MRSESLGYGLDYFAKVLDTFSQTLGLVLRLAIDRINGLREVSRRFVWSPLASASDR